MEIELTTNRMTDIIKILQREQEESNRIYLYEENGCWYAYERSAFYLSQMLKGIALERFIVQKDTIWLVRAQIDFNHLPHEQLTSCSDEECILSYVPPTNHFYDWISRFG